MVEGARSLTEQEVEEWNKEIDRFDAEAFPVMRTLGLTYLDAPWWEYSAERFERESEETLKTYPRLKGGLVELVEPKAYFLVMRVRLLEAQLAVALAMYKLEHGSRPEALSNLVPEEFDALPIDPFCGASFHYRNQTKGCELWSVGPDGKNDDARVTYDPTNGTLSAGDVIPRVRGN